MLTSRGKVSRWWWSGPSIAVLHCAETGIFSENDEDDDSEDTYIPKGRPLKPTSGANPFPNPKR